MRSVWGLDGTETDAPLYETDGPGRSAFKKNLQLISEFSNVSTLGATNHDYGNFARGGGGVIGYSESLEGGGMNKL